MINHLTQCDTGFGNEVVRLEAATPILTLVLTLILTLITDETSQHEFRFLRWGLCGKHFPPRGAVAAKVPGVPFGRMQTKVDPEQRNPAALIWQTFKELVGQDWYVPHRSGFIWSQMQLPLELYGSADGMAKGLVDVLNEEQISERQEAEDVFEQLREREHSAGSFSGLVHWRLAVAYA